MKNNILKDNLMKSNSISSVIADRLAVSDKRYWASDNISAYLQPGELELLVDEVKEKFEEVLTSLVIDTRTDPNSMDTAKRLAKMYVYELMSGRYQPKPTVTSFPNDGSERFEGMLVVRAELTSMCSHHHQPVKGVAYIGIIPTLKVIGLSKYIRLAQHCARRGTLQEELCGDIANAIMKATGSNSVAVYIEADHGCCTNRGIMAHSAMTQTTVIHGEFHDMGVKNEFFSNIKLQKINCG
jgi:GTP cyclohydrolase I